MKIRYLLLVLTLVSAAPALATTYSVKKDGSGNYTTIQACADDAKAGDTCEVYSGTYSGSVTPSNDGASGKWITFKAAAGSSPVMTGGWNLEGRDYIVIDGFTCGGISANSSSSAAASNIKILNNLIQNTGVGINIKGNDVLVSGNTFNNMANDMVRQFGDRWTVRNNVVIDESDSNDEHMDFWQSWCNPSGIAASYYLIENNTYINVLGGNAHFALINGTSSCNDPTTNSIVRYNKIYNIGSLGSYIDSNSAASGSKDNVIYNNTWVRLNEGSSATWQNYSHNYSASSNSALINNIFYDAMYPSKAEGIAWKSGTQSNNLYYDSDSLMTFANSASSEIGAVKNENPLLKNPSKNDFTLSSNSPAINAGGPLTKVASADGGSGTSLIVEGAMFFQPGWGGVDSDWIAVGSATNVAKIAAINYSTNTITLATSISRHDGDPVYLYKDSDGTRVLYGSAPDIGAVEFGSDGTSTPPPDEDPVDPGIDLPGKVNNLRITTN